MKKAKKKENEAQGTHPGTGNTSNNSREVTTENYLDLFYSKDNAKGSVIGYGDSSIIHRRNSVQKRK